MTNEEFDRIGWRNGMFCRVASIDESGNASVRRAKIVGVRFSPRVIFVRTADGRCKSVQPIDVLIDK